MGDELSKICWILKLCGGKIQNKQKLYELCRDLQENKILDFGYLESFNTFIDNKPGNEQFNSDFGYLKGKTLIFADDDDKTIYLSATGERKAKLFLENKLESGKEDKITLFIHSYPLI